MPDLKKGEIAPLNVTQEARHRFFVGLGWDPAEPGFLDKVQGIARIKETHHDLDLSCYIFDTDKNLANIVDVTSENAADDTGQIYHSGDNVKGIGEGDDEEISVELKDLPEHLESIIFVSTIKTANTFADVQSPEIRIADGYTSRNFMSCEINAMEGSNKNGFIFCQVNRFEGDGWHLRNVSEFFDTDSVDDIALYLRDSLI